MYSCVYTEGFRKWSFGKERTVMADYREEFNELSREVVVRALFENYESIYNLGK